LIVCRKNKLFQQPSINWNEEICCTNRQPVTVLFIHLFLLYFQTHDIFRPQGTIIKYHWWQFSAKTYYILIVNLYCRSQWPRGLRRRSAATRLLRLGVRIPPGAWMAVSCGCCVLSGRGLCDELITRPEESYRMWCVVVCDLETSLMRRPWPTGGCCAKGNKEGK